MLETVRIRRAGYPVRRTYEDFLFRYISRLIDSNKQVGDKTKNHPRLVQSLNGHYSAF